MQKYPQNREKIYERFGSLNFLRKDEPYNKRIIIGEQKAGQLINFYLLINNSTIELIRFKAFANTASVVIADYLCCAVQGLTVDETLTNLDARSLIKKFDLENLNIETVLVDLIINFCVQLGSNTN